MRRLATGVSALALLSACTASAYLWRVPMYASLSTTSTSTSSAVTTGLDSQTLVGANGSWVTVLLVGVTLLCGLPLCVAVAVPGAQRGATWSTALLVLGFSIISGFSVGLFFMPSALLLLVSAILTVFVKEGETPADGSHGGMV